MQQLPVFFIFDSVVNDELFTLGNFGEHMFIIQVVVQNYKKNSAYFILLKVSFFKVIIYPLVLQSDILDERSVIL